jgi:hypothetical protein
MPLSVLVTVQDATYCYRFAWISAAFIRRDSFGNWDVPSIFTRMNKCRNPSTVLACTPRFIQKCCAWRRVAGHEFFQVMASIVRKNLLAPRHALAASDTTLVLESAQSM